MKTHFRAETALRSIVFRKGFWNHPPGSNRRPPGRHAGDQRQNGRGRPLRGLVPIFSRLPTRQVSTSYRITFQSWRRVQSPDRYSSRRDLCAAGALFTASAIGNTGRILYQVQSWQSRGLFLVSCNPTGDGSLDAFPAREAAKTMNNDFHYDRHEGPQGKRRRSGFKGSQLSF